MTRPADEFPSDQAKSPVSIFALVIWLGVQLLALGLAAARVPLWARYPSPGDELAIDFMLVTQIVFAGLLFPVLLSNVRATATLILTSAVFIHLAGLLADVPLPRMALGWVFVGGWMVALWLTVPFLKRFRAATLLGIAIATCLTLGGPLLLYLRLESAPAYAPDWPTLGFLGPTTGALAIIHAPTFHHHPWTASGALLALGISLRLASRWSARQVVHQLSTTL